MIINNIKLASRNLLKNKWITAINVFGLTLGITVSLMIFAYVRKEKTTDTFLPGYESIYAVTNNGESNFSQNMVNLIKEKLPEAENVTYCCKEWSPQVFFTNNHKSYKIDKMLDADSCFFRVFQFEPVWGNPATALSTSNKIVITQSLAAKIFGNENPMGKTVGYNSSYLQNQQLEVGAVIRDLPQNASWDFEAVISLQTNYKISWYVGNMKSWAAQNYQAFCRANEHVSQAALSKKIAAMPLDAVPDFYKKDIRLGLFPFSKVYFDFPDIDVRHGNSLALSIIQIIAILILLLACVNYINLVTAQREKRSKNIGIIKTMGSSKQQVVQLLTVESGLVLSLTVLISLLLSMLLTDKMNAVTNSHFTFQTFLSGWNLLILMGIFLFTLIVTGVVPGYLFSKNETSLLLKKQSSGQKENILRNGLLVFQFAISIALISGVMLIVRQNRYMNSVNPGFQKENIVYAFTNKDLEHNVQSFKNELKNIPGVADITFSEEPINKIDQNWGLDLINKGERSEVEFAKFTVAPNFFNFFGIRMKQGNCFNDHAQTNKDFIFNETAVNKFKITNMDDAKIDGYGSGKCNIVAVAEDFNFESMHVPIRPVGFMCSGESDGVVYLKFNAGSYNAFQQNLQSVRKVWDKLSPHFPMEITFLDSSWEALYVQDRQFQKIISYTTIISLILSCLGLIGLTFFVMERRTKEIGVRKVNGARISEVMILLNRDFVKWVAIAFVIATPIAYYAMNKWLENFAYKTELSWWIFALSGILALGIALITVSWQSWRAATRNPVEALRYE